MHSSISKMKSNRKPPIPLPRSPISLRPRRSLYSSDSTSVQTPPGSLTKSRKPIRSLEIEESALRPEYRTISCELRALAKMVSNEFGNADQENISVAAGSCSVNSGVLFERGRFYDEYSARRNEKLKRRKKGVTADESKPAYGLGVTVESAKKASSSRRLESVRKSVSAAFSVEKSETPRYMLRSMTKENKKPPLPANFDKSIIGGEKKIGALRTRRI